MSKKIIVQGRPLTSLPSGNKTFTMNFLQYVAELLPQIQFDILVPNQISSSSINLPNNCHIITIKSIATQPEYISTVLWEQIQTYDYIKSQKLNDIAFFLSTHHSLPLEKLPIPEMIILHDIHLWTHPDNDWSESRKLGYIANKFGIRNAEKIFTVSNFTKNEIMKEFKWISKDPIVINEDIDPNYKQKKPFIPELIKKSFKVDPNEYFLYVGSFEKRKNLPFLIEAYKSYLLKSKLKKKLVIIGAHTTRSKEVVGYDFPQTVSVFETATVTELYNLYAQATSFIYPSIYEGFGLQILEAQNSQCPVLASDIEVFHEVGGDKGVFFFNPFNKDDLAEKLLEIEDNNNLRLNLIQEGLANSKRFEWHKTAQLFISNIKELI